MDYNSAREEITNNWERILAQITSPAKEKVNGRTSYICPICGHGTHGDGLTINPRSKDGKSLKCFGSCNFSGSIIDLIGKVEGLTDYPEMLKRAGEYVGVTVDGRSSAQEDFKPAQKQTKNEQTMSMRIDTYTQEAEKDSLIPYYRECQKHLKETAYLTQREIRSEEVAKRFMLGYDSQFKTQDRDTKAYTVWQALIIPTGPHSYTVRNTDLGASDGNRYRNRGSGAIFNSQSLQTATKPIFITEGEIDALSIIEVGGEAVGLGSTSNVNLFINGYAKKQKPVQPLVLALDNDEAGQKATEKLVNALDELGIPYCVQDPYNGQKDANSALVTDREAFTQAIREAEKVGEELLNAQKEEYLRNSVAHHIREFVDGIANSVNTPYIPTGFTNLDRILDGGLYEGLYIVGAISSLGKTTVITQIADQIAEGGEDVLIFSLEMARTEIMAKSISRLTLLDVLQNGGKISDAKTNRGITTGSRYAYYSDTEKALIQRAVEAYGGFAEHIFIHEGVGNIGVDKVREEVDKHIRFTGKKPVIVIDYLQILAPADVRATDKQNTDKAVLELKRISRDFKIPVIGISSFNRQNYKEAVTMEAYKESGAIEYSADVLIGLQLRGAGSKGFDANEAKARNPREVELVILKNRNGATGKTIMEYYPLFNYFKEV